MSKHVMLSYQWDVQDLVKKIYDHLSAMGIPVWMDIQGGMAGNINDSMAQGVDGAAVVCPFMTTKYQDSKNCKKELNYADHMEVAIVPVMAENSFKATGWLGIITAGALWIDFRKTDNMNNRIESLAKEIMSQVGDLLKKVAPKPLPAPSGGAKKAAPKPVAFAKPKGRAFQHAISGKFLAETGQVKFHPASGSRSSLATTDSPQDTSFWTEELKDKKSGIRFFKNVHTAGYLGHDPNGDYFYTKGQHYGAEEWTIENDDTDSSGRRAVVLKSVFGKKYIAFRGGKFTGVDNKGDDCKWFLE